jgi:hypothetical protein
MVDGRARVRSCELFAKVHSAARSLLRWHELKVIPNSGGLKGLSPGRWEFFSLTFPSRLFSGSTVISVLWVLRSMG